MLGRGGIEIGRRRELMSKEEAPVRAGAVATKEKRPMVTKQESSTKHTPGPWAIEYDGPSLPIITAAPRREIIALARGENAEANARLLAVSPEMYEALDRLVTIVGEALIDEMFDADEDWIEGLREAHHVGLAVIIKAEGGAS